MRENENKSGKFLKRKPFTHVDGQPAEKVKREEVQMVESDANTQAQSIEDEYEDIFCIDSNGEKNKMWFIVGGIDVEGVVDSGTRYNIVDRESWMELKAKGIVTTHRQKEVDI